jgi:hypothetical protein
MASARVSENAGRGSLHSPVKRPWTVSVVRRTSEDAFFFGHMVAPWRPGGCNERVKRPFSSIQSRLILPSTPSCS